MWRGWGSTFNEPINVKAETGRSKERKFRARANNNNNRATGAQERRKGLQSDPLSTFTALLNDNR